MVINISEINPTLAKLPYPWHENGNHCYSQSMSTLILGTIITISEFTETQYKDIWDKVEEKSNNREQNWISFYSAYKTKFQSDKPLDTNEDYIVSCTAKYLLSGRKLPPSDNFDSLGRYYATWWFDNGLKGRQRSNYFKYNLIHYLGSE